MLNFTRVIFYGNENILSENQVVWERSYSNWCNTVIVYRKKNVFG